MKMDQYLFLLLIIYICISNAFLKVNNNINRIRKLNLLENKKNDVKSITIPNKDKNMQFYLGRIAFSFIPLAPETGGRRKTILEEIVPNTIWTLDQIQGIINVLVPVRSTIIKLKAGGLWVHNPIAPTDECIEYMRSLENQHGKVKYIVLSSTALEHKGTAGAFTRNFPNAEIWIQPGQYSFPINLPSALFFPAGAKIKEIPTNFYQAPWAEEIDHRVLDPIRPPGPGTFSETAFYHKSSRTLLVTDTIAKIENDPPKIVAEDPRALLYHSRDNRREIVQDTPENRRKGWRRMVLFGLTFFPSGIDVASVGEVISTLDEVPEEMAKLGEGALPFSSSLYAWSWARDERPNFKALQNGLLVAPILQKLILNRDPERVLKWVNEVCKWPFRRIIPCHLANNIKASPKDFEKAFTFLKTSEKEDVKSISAVSGGSSKSYASALDSDLALLNTASDILTNLRIIYPAKV